MAEKKTFPLVTVLAGVLGKNLPHFTGSGAMEYANREDVGIFMLGEGEQLAEYDANEQLDIVVNEIKTQYPALAKVSLAEPEKKITDNLEYLRTLDLHSPEGKKAYDEFMASTIMEWVRDFQAKHHLPDSLEIEALDESYNRKKQPVGAELAHHITRLTGSIVVDASTPQRMSASINAVMEDKALRNSIENALSKKEVKETFITNYTSAGGDGESLREAISRAYGATQLSYTQDMSRKELVAVYKKTCPAITKALATGQYNAETESTFRDLETNMNKYIALYAELKKLSNRGSITL